MPSRSTESLQSVEFSYLSNLRRRLQEWDSALTARKFQPGNLMLEQTNHQPVRHGSRVRQMTPDQLSLFTPRALAFRSGETAACA
jgi:hypothetical protein